MSSEPRTLNRSHAQAATLFWFVIIVMWVPVSALVIIGGVGNPAELLVGLAAIAVVGVPVCAVGTIRAVRGRPFIGGWAQ
jgi:hypothetical protein